MPPIAGGDCGLELPTRSIGMFGLWYGRAWDEGIPVEGRKSLETTSF